MIFIVAVLLLAYLIYVAVRLGLPLRLSRLHLARPPLTHVLEWAAARRDPTGWIETEAPLSWHAPCHNRPGAQPSRWSAAQAFDTVCRLAGVFAHLGLQPAERVAIYKANEFDLFLFASGAMRAGGIAAPMNANLDPEITARYLDHLGARVLMTDCSNFRRLFDQRDPPRTLRHVIVVDAAGADLPSGVVGARVLALESLLRETPAVQRAVPRGGSDPIYIFHTSGTTGVPKGVIVTAGSMAQSLRAVLRFNPVSRRDLAYFALPLNHQVSHLYLHALFLLGIRAILSRDMNPGRALQTLARRRVTIYFGFPITYAGMIQAGIGEYDLSSMRIWGATADPSHEVHQRAFVQTGGFFRQLGVPIRGSVFVDGLGSSEVGIAALLRIVAPWTKTFGRRVGRPTPGGPKIRIVDETGAAVAPGCPGRLLITGPCMFAGYWNAHDLLYGATRDGWWFTGDIVRRDASGEYVHLDREVDVITGKAGCSYTLLIEEMLLKHPAVHDACVFGVLGADGGEVPAAIVALRGGVEGVAAQQLRAEVNDTLPPRDRLHHIWLVEWSAFPIGATGKTLKRVLRERYNRLLREEYGERKDATSSADMPAAGMSLPCAI